MFWGGAIFTTGWILRCISSYHPSNLSLYIAQTVFIYAGPPVYSAAEYNTLGRFMRYVPMLAPLNPDRVIYFFIYLGIAVESLTGAGAGQSAGADGDLNQYKLGELLISAALALQGVVELVFMFTLGVVHYRCVKHKMMTRNIRNLCIMLYGTSSLILFRCIFRAIQSFGQAAHLFKCDSNSLCRFVNNHEWYIYVFEAAPMVLYTVWINLVHPGRLLPRNKNHYLDLDGRTERLGPGWVDRRSKLMTYLDPLDFMSARGGESNHDKFWLRPDDWAVAPDGSFAEGTATNVSENFWPAPRSGSVRPSGKHP